MTDERNLKRGRWSDHQVEQVIGRLLQIGVLLATAVVIVGAVGVLLHHGATPVSFRDFAGESSPWRSLGAVVHGAARGEFPAIVQLGLVLLIATPVARVALTLGAFAAQKDRLYVLLTAVVLALLLYGLIWGKA
ncbi:MAG: DUF1634 domain-containing protein [Gemmatimonadaceae bacterium]|nr:DUF1634 domain-containing protein [Gemmatimonadaceae bacterium]NUQ92109.1 DUF1634 domain-containing protein [Gemmatimonadaceae bacterium]NUR33135.1 DUF1634 domain-containing protein [Gemmatimonadaceae bacterium]NUS97795.1 DUF1634 domain-containing protein [Gemmatimonadaceae bacterium]